MEILSERLKTIFTCLIKEHTVDGEPVGSKILVRHYDLGLSPATVRNNLAELEGMGFLYQPVFGAGRLPTDKGWRYYVDYIDENKFEENITDVYKEGTPESLRNLARIIAEYSNAVGLAYNSQSGQIYKYGLAKLLETLSKEEDAVSSVVEFMEQMDWVIDDLIKKAADGKIKIFIGRENPISKNSFLSTIVFKIPRVVNLIIIGPKHMRYGRNAEILERVAGSLT